MVVLVRCIDDTFTLALESRLKELTSTGLISAFLCNGSWVKVEHPTQRKTAPRRRSCRRLTAQVACF